MIKLPTLAVAAFTTAAIALAASPSFAETMIKVVEGGEGGEPMTLKLEPAAVNAGPVTFMVHNDAVTETHEMVVVKLKKADQVVPVNTKKHRINEKDFKSLGEVSDLKPGKDGTLKVDLKAGTYLVFCNIKGHFEAGMQARLTVNPAKVGS